MIISSPEITQKRNLVTVSAQITLEHHPLNKPDTAWFAFPEKFLPFISGRTDPFAAGLLPLALALHEDLYIEGLVSPRLMYGMNEYQMVMSAWFPKLMSPVKIKSPAQEVLPAEHAGQTCVTLFSGGVDSTFTLMSHLPDRRADPAFQAKGALFIHGLDIPLQNQNSFAESLKIFNQQLALQGVEVIPCATNLHYFTSGLLSWEIAHGGAIIGTGLVLDKLIGNLLIPSSYSLDELIPWGSSPLIDHLLSTETVKVSHHGATASRIEKVEAVSNWKPAQNFLRVCVDEKKRSAVNNCSKCEKCIRTMTMLEICGTLPAVKTFQQPFGKWDILKWTPHYEAGEVWIPQTLSFARTRRKNEYVFPLLIAHLKGKIRNGLRNLIPRRLFNWLKVKKFPYQNDPFNPDFLDDGLKTES
ncbi:MAG: hypothetical protein K8R77_03340 [Anaerolineaceae bacterium]|nr:hypothetical protein [Anaerolineaceae bacterium]